MDLQLDFVKSDNDVWGFRLKGGAEYDLPFLVVHVAENGVADRAGLRCNDVIVSVNGTPTDGLIHNETHALLLSAGNNLILGIRRGLTDLISPMTYDDGSNEEICNIMQAYIQSDEEFEHQRQVDFEIVNPSEETPIIVEENSEAVPQPLPEERMDAPLRENAISGIKDKKWSSFLQKPKNPVPAPKKHQQEEGPKAEPYRVLIVKQKKRTPEELRELRMKKLKENKDEEVDSELGQVESVDDGQVSTILEEEEANEDENTEENEEDGKIDDETEEKPHEETAEDDNIDGPLAEEDNVADDEGLTSSQNEEQEEADAELQKFLAEKLAEVQKQLEALSKLPSTMQSTIDALNKQLVGLVGVSNPADENEEKESSRGNSESGDAAEQIVTEDENEGENFEVDREDDEENEGSGEHPKDDADEQLEREEGEQVEEDADKEPELTEEQIEAMRLEQEWLEKQQKERELMEEFQQRRLKQKPTLPCKPIQRPIILPGGRRWSQPDDAIPVISNKKMTDEKIANTIETYSEVISGRTKGLTIGIRFGRGPMSKSPFTGIVRLT